MKNQSCEDGYCPDCHPAQQQSICNITKTIINFTCSKCGKTTDKLINNLCSFCYLNDLNTVDHQYNYKCPDCKGEFNSPASDSMSTTSNPNYRCPWCGKKMEGL